MAITREAKQRVIARDGGKCIACGATENLTIDHVVPRSKGGGNKFKNLQTLCRDCNVKKAGLNTDLRREAKLRDEAAGWKQRALEAESAINETLRLADRLNEFAEGGAGFADHWGERVLQAVEPLRDVKAFASETLAHNRMLLESNGAYLAERNAAEAREAGLCEEIEYAANKLRMPFATGPQQALQILERALNAPAPDSQPAINPKQADSSPAPEPATEARGEGPLFTAARKIAEHSSILVTPSPVEARGAELKSLTVREWAFGKKPTPPPAAPETKRRHDDKSLCAWCNSYRVGEHEPRCRYATPPQTIPAELGRRALEALEWAQALPALRLTCNSIVDRAARDIRAALEPQAQTEEKP